MFHTQASMSVGFAFVSQIVVCRLVLSCHTDFTIHKLGKFSPFFYKICDQCYGEPNKLEGLSANQCRCPM